VREFRNNVAFHLGWSERIVRTTADLANERARENVWETDGKGPFEIRYSGGENVLLRASGLQQRQSREIAEFSLEAWRALFGAVQAIFHDLLRECGTR